jgi:hypothetical protein
MSEPELLNGVVADPDDLFDLQRFALQLVLPVMEKQDLLAVYRVGVQIIDSEVQGHAVDLIQKKRNKETHRLTC